MPTLKNEIRDYFVVEDETDLQYLSSFPANKNPLYFSFNSENPLSKISDPENADKIIYELDSGKLRMRSIPKRDMKQLNGQVIGTCIEFKNITSSEEEILKSLSELFLTKTNLKSFPINLLVIHTWQ